MRTRLPFGGILVAQHDFDGSDGASHHAGAALDMSPRDNPRLRQLTGDQTALGSRVAAPAPLALAHDLEAFTSGVPPLDHALKPRARQNEAGRASRTYVVGEGSRAVGYYNLAAGSVLHHTATGWVRRNLPEPVPVALFGGLAIDHQRQGRDFGASLLRDAILRVIAAETICVRAILVDAISDEAKAFYEHWSLRASPVEPMALMITVDGARGDVRANQLAK